ncbi:MAG: glycosyltransferase family 4 protein [Candidatus Omnitrophota bacterium]
MKILMCNKFHFINGGAERYLFDLCKGLKHLGHEVFHFSTRDQRNFDSECQHFFVNNRDYRDDKPGDFFSKIWIGVDAIYSFKAKNQVAGLIEQHHPQVIHVHNIYHQISPSILDVFKKKRIPVVMTVHDYKMICPNYKLFVNGRICECCQGRQYYHCLLKRCMKGSLPASFVGMLEAYLHTFLKSYEAVDIFIVPSCFVFEKMLKFGIPRKKLKLLPCAVDLSEFVATPGVGKYILYFGRLLVEKGLVTLLDSLKNLPDVHLKIIGDGPLGGELKRVIETQRLSRVEILSHCSRESLNVILREALCVIIPSEWPEPMGLVIHEAFASGRCVIASSAGGIPEMVQDGVNGLLFEAGNADDLAQKIQFIITHPDQARQWGENGLLKIQQHNDHLTHVKQVNDIYHQLLNAQVVV